MSNQLRKRSPAEWFLESFFQERNIKWMLALGVMIVFGSSLMLVTSKWDSWSPLWKALAVIGYSGAVFGCGELAFCRLGLRNTGTVMRSLTLLLLPLSFLAVHRLGEMSLPVQIGLLVLDGALTTFAARRIFQEFLRGPQPTLVASYVALAAAGGVLTPMTGIAAPIVALVIWAIFSVGTVKSARQVFWLAEEHKRPRVFGFVPILLLGAQFLTLFVLNCASEFTWQWLGLGYVMFAVPVLMTTDAIAKVFQQRTGDLVRPLPWSIVLPLFVGLTLCVVGVGMAAIPQVGRSLFSLALTPAAGLAALMMLVAARRTRHSAFVWAGLIGAAVAYQASPAYFIETARLVVHSAATVVHEQRLPVAFYGLTWLPLILAATFASVRAARHRDDLIAEGVARPESSKGVADWDLNDLNLVDSEAFDAHALRKALGRATQSLIAIPCRQFATSVAILLFALSFTHVKAIFPVAAASTLAFGLQAAVFGQRRLVLGAALAWTALTASSQFFANEICLVPMSNDLHRLVMLLGAAMLLVVRSVVRMPTSGLASTDRTWASGLPAGLPLYECGIVSLIHTILIGGAWLLAAEPVSAMSLVTAGGFATAALLMVHAAKWLKPGLGELSLAFLLAVIAKSMFFLIPNDGWLFFGCTLPPLAMWLVGQQLRNRTSRIAAAFAGPSVRVSAIGLTLLLMVSQGGLLFANLGLIQGAANCWQFLIPAVISALWSYDVARRSSISQSIQLAETVTDRSWRMSFGVLGCISVLILTGSILLGAGHLSWIPVAWALMSLVTVLVQGVAFHGIPTESLGPIAQPARVISMAVLVLTSVVTLFVNPFAALARFAGLIAVGGLLLDVALSLRDRKAVSQPDTDDFSDSQRSARPALLSRSDRATFADKTPIEPLEATLMLGQWQLAMLVATLMGPGLGTLSDLFSSAALPAALPVALTVAGCLTALRLWRQRHTPTESGGLHSVLSVTVIAYALLATAAAPMASAGSVAMALGTFAILAAGEFVLAVRRQRVDGVWMAQGIVATAIAWLFVAGVISIGHGVAMFACTGTAVLLLATAKVCAANPRLAFAAEAFRLPANALPMIAVAIGIGRHLHSAGETGWLGMNSLALLMSAAFYFWRGMETQGNVADLPTLQLDQRNMGTLDREVVGEETTVREFDFAESPTLRRPQSASTFYQTDSSRDYFVASAVILNVALGLLWRELRFSDPQFFMIPAGLTILWLVELLKREIPESYRDPLRYAGALTILVSPTFHIVSGSWLHLISLMVCSVVVALLAIGLRLRALVYSGTAFLIADLVAMVIRGSIDRPNLLWLAGLAIGASVITLGAICENHRERLLTRLRVMAAELQTWK